jgi:hypothetical protein
MVTHGLAIMIYVVGGMSRGQRGLMMTLVRVAAGGVMGVGLHVGGSVLDCRIRKVVGDFILLVLFRRNSEV